MLNLKCPDIDAILRKRKPKKCLKCGEYKDGSDFHLDKTREDGLYSYCKDCVKSYQKERLSIEPKKRIKVYAGNKQCRKCGEVKEISLFYPLKRSKDGLDSICIECDTLRKKEYRDKNRKHCNEIDRDRRRNIRRIKYPKPEVPEGMKICSVCKEIMPLTDFHRSSNNNDGLNCSCKCCSISKVQGYQANRREIIKEYNADYRTKNKEIIKAKAIEERQKNPEKYRELSKKWRLKYWDKTVVYMRNKRRTDYSYRIHSNVSNGLKGHLKKNGFKKDGKWEKILGYTTKELMDHLRVLFQPGMNWENYSYKWEIDHVLPLSLFRIKGPNDMDTIIKAWALQNLQPLFKEENRRKTNKIIPEMIERAGLSLPEGL